MIVKQSSREYTDTVDALIEAIERRGLSVFARIARGRARGGAHRIFTG